MNGYAAYDDNGIWATGTTPEDAIATFEREAQAQATEYSPLRTAPMTEQLAAHVEAHGFDCQRDSYDVLPDGTLDMAR